ncbi:MAG: WbuC family cupin fold metalloprotein [Bacteroidales bacterium]
MIHIDNQLLDKVTEEAKASPRKRKNFNFHPTLDDPLHRMLNAIEPGSYLRPHKHENPGKMESFILLRGKLAVFEFSPSGEIVDATILSHDEGKVGVEFPPAIFHTVLSIESGTVVYEVKNGPYSALDDKNFAEWAPAEGDAEVEDYLKKLEKYINKKIT